MTRRPALLGLIAALACGPGLGATAYVSDDLVLGVYSEQDNRGSRLATLHSGMSVEILGSSGEFSQVRLGDGRTGWVKSAYLMGAEPAAARVKRLEEELARFRATTPVLAAAAARSEVVRLQDELAATKEALRNALAAGSTPTYPKGSPARNGLQFFEVGSALAIRLWLYAAGTVLAVVGGFWLGYATLARRVKQKFGGIKVY